MPAELHVLSKPKRCFWRYGMKTLLASMMVTCLLLGAQADRLRRARTQRQAVAAIGRLGGTVVYDGTQLNCGWLCGIVGVDLLATANGVVFWAYPSMNNAPSTSPFSHPHGRITDGDLVLLRYLPHLRKLVLWNTQASDRGLVHIKELTALRRLTLHGTAVTDAGLVHLKDLSKLRILHLNNTRINGTGLVHLTDLNNLHMLALGDTQVSDAALPYLCGLQALTHLNLSGTRITDAGIIHLTCLANLRCLCVERTRVTADGMRRIKRALPRLDCRGPEEDSRYAL